MLKHLVITLFLMGFTLPALADDTSRANELLVEATQLLQSAEGTADAAEKLRLSEEALGNLNEIVKRYPSTDLAVKLITGQAIGNISLESVAEAVEVARGGGKIETEQRAWNTRLTAAREAGWSACLASPTSACVMAHVLALQKNLLSPTSKSRDVINEKAQVLAIMHSFLAPAQAAVGDIEGARESVAIALHGVEKIEEAGFVALAYPQIALAQVAVGDVKRAKDSVAIALHGVEKIEEAGLRSLAFTQLALAQVAVGDVKQAKDSVAIALHGVEKIEEAVLRPLAFTQLALAQIQIGDTKGARESVAIASAELENTDFSANAAVRDIFRGLLAQGQAAVGGNIKEAKESISIALYALNAIKQTERTSPIKMWIIHALILRALTEME